MLSSFTHTGLGLWVGLCCLAWSLSEAPAAERRARGSAKAKASAGPAFDKDIQPLLQRYCHDCHGEKKKGDLDLRPYGSAEAVLEAREVWELVLKNLRSREMPPSGKPQPTQAERELLSGWVEKTLLQTDCDNPDPGRVTIRRLNRFEYNNTIRDLVGVDFQPADDFPADDSGYGFDNIGDALSLPPVLLEKYLAAADKILAKALDVDSEASLRKRRFSAHALEGSAPGESLDGGARMLAREGDIYVDHEPPVAGRYAFRVRAYGQQAGPEPVRMAVSVDGKVLREFVVKAEENAPEVFEVEVPIETAGTRHRFAVAYLNNYVNPEDPNPRNRDRNLIVEYLELEAPAGLEPVVPARPAAHARIFFRPPGTTPQQQLDSAGEVIGRFAKRAYRRPVTRAEAARLLKLYQAARADGEAYEGAVRLALQAVLVSPHFLFRGELQPEPDNPAAVHPIGEHALASRLSYFLWSSLPDDELTALADRGRLRRNLDGQVRRMLKDPKAAALVESFAGQWLQLRNLAVVSPDAWQFPEFDDALRVAMRRETEVFFETLIREDRSVLELLDANYTFVNERLARHYGIAGVQGEEFRRVSLEGTGRGGVLTHASVLTITSNPTRTSPVKRGKWILENILGTPPPPPPPDVPELSEAKEVVLSGTLRQRMVQHRENPNCATCHARMDPIGFGFENFNAIGGWREKDGTFAIEPDGEFVSGEKFKGPEDLKTILTGAKREDFLRCLAEKTLTYALGRGLEFYDTCAIEQVKSALVAGNYRFSALVLGVVKSVPFDQRRGEGQRVAALDGRE